MFKRKLSRKGNILTENIIFIVLNLTFIIILMLFLFSKTGETSVLEEKYTKQIALLIDSAEPGMTIDLNMEDAIKAAGEENFPVNEIVRVNGNVVTVRLNEDSEGYSYSFFNDIDVRANFDTASRTKYYFIITQK